MINGKALFVGVFLAAAGTVMLVGQGDAVARDAIASALRLWPLAVIAIGAGLILRRTRLNLAGAVVAALVPGLLFGGVVVAAPDPDFASICTERSGEATTTRSGSFTGDAEVDLDFSCGEIRVTTIPGTSWDFQARDQGDRTASVVSRPDRLAIQVPDGRAGSGWDREGDAWAVRLPADTLLDITADISAGRGRLDLAGARLGTLALDVSAGDARVDLSNATLSRLDLVVGAGAATVLLPDATSFRGDLSVSAGAIELCIPAGLGVRILDEVALGSTTFNGLIRANDAWETPGYATATHRAELMVSVSAGSVDVNPEGGCT